ncbi:hypothetical protein [Pseudocnuella soli]|uniref:hypothetical protein n=1 Tax=Pseudocnuella soli TaxID=2502779 RepID=UPI00104F6A6E|nr:hypothetical protein [Pseudocnuella soli]
MENNNDLSVLLQQLPANASDEAAWLHRMGLVLNELILHDFNRLVQLLYRVDVSEKMVKELLQQHPEANAGLLLARLLLQRQQQKLASRNQFRNDAHIPDEERW